MHSREVPSSPPCPPCSFRTVPSQTWRSWCAPATGRMGPCRCCRCVGGRGGASWRARVLLLTRLVSFQKSIRPQVVTTFELPGCYDMWTVIAPVRKEQVGAPQVGEAWAVRGPRAATHLARVWVAQRLLVPAPGSANLQLRRAWPRACSGSVLRAPGAGRWDSCSPSAFTGGEHQGGGGGAGAQRPRSR